MFDRLIEVSGIHDPKEVSRTFIKNQEQNQNLLNYLKNLSEKRQIYDDKMVVVRKDIGQLETKLEQEKIKLALSSDDWSQEKIDSELDKL